jgi:tetratricopeptide (TPR) repeat protein
MVEFVATDDPANTITHVIDRYEASLRALETNRDHQYSAVCEIFLNRDAIQELIDAHAPVAFAVYERLNALDDQLRACAKSIRPLLGSSFVKLRELVGPPKRQWWWYPDRNNPIWLIAAIALLALSLGLLADLTRRILSADPDELGIIAIAGQIALTIGAGSTFTEHGRRMLRDTLNRTRLSLAGQDILKFVATLLLFVIASISWEYLPGRLAIVYNNQAIRISEANPAAALRLYQRATDLDPTQIVPHVNLAALYRRNFDYANAAAEARKALLLVPGDPVASTHLALVLMQDNNPVTALRALDYAALVQSPDKWPMPSSKAAYFENRARAEYLQGYLEEAKYDAKQSLSIGPASPATYCVLAEVLQKQGQHGEALTAWRQMLGIVPSNDWDPLQNPIEPECSLRANEATHESTN